MFQPPSGGFIQFSPVLQGRASESGGFTLSVMILCCGPVSGFLLSGGAQAP